MYLEAAAKHWLENAMSMRININQRVLRHAILGFVISAHAFWKKKPRKLKSKHVEDYLQQEKHALSQLQSILRAS
jgi:hypothetical protein